MPSKKKKYNARFPPARIKKIMQTDDEVGKVAAAVPVIISRALELFVEALVKNSSEITKARNAKTLTTSHLKACILSDGHYHFLKDLVATIPDVQGDEEPCTPLPLEGQPAVIAPRLSNRGRKPKNRNGEGTAGPSHSTADESETATDEEEDADGDSEEASSETTYISDNQVPNVANSRIVRNPAVNYMPANQIQLSGTTANNNTDDDDYDS